MKTTNYYNTFIEVAEDCPVSAGEIPPQKGEEKTVARHQFEILRDNPYTFTSDEILFAVHAQRNNVSRSEMETARDAFFAKSQACFRSSPLPKRYGWGIHFDSDGKMALFAKDSTEYTSFVNNSSVTKLKAMRSKRK
jgi:hypothetical protein